MVDQLCSLLLAAQESPASDLPPPLRAAAMMAILGVALLGLLLIVGTMLGGHWVRRWGNRQRGPAVPQDVLPVKPPTRTPPSSTDAKPLDGDTARIEETRHS